MYDCCIEQILDLTSHETRAVRPPTPYHKNHPSIKTNKACRTLLAKQGRNYQCRFPMGPSNGRVTVGRLGRKYQQQP